MIDNLFYYLDNQVVHIKHGGKEMPATFPSHTIESAPVAARRAMNSVQDHQGFLPHAVARLANSPQTLDGFLKMNAIFESCSLDPIAREVLVLTIATRNGCHLCVAMHTARLTKLGADAALIEALRESKPLDDERLDAVRIFTLRVLETTGDVGDEALQAFFAHGYTPQNALEIVLGIGTYTLSTLANRLTGAPVDEQLAPFAWHG
jgi:AhpD family alkylhydroperoxidase